MANLTPPPQRVPEDLTRTLARKEFFTALKNALYYVFENARNFAHGNESITPDANGEGTIAHGLNATPTYINANLRGDNVNGVDAVSVDGTNITVRIKDASGADVTTGTFTVDWEARK